MQAVNAQLRLLICILATVFPVPSPILTPDRYRLKNSKQNLVLVTNYIAMHASLKLNLRLSHDFASESDITSCIDR